MMEYKSIQVDSYIGMKLELELAVQDSDTLLVLLPGADYNIWGPSFYYSYSMGSELGFDVLSIFYGFERQQKRFDFAELSSLVKDCKTAIDESLQYGNYSGIVFIARSLGTLVLSELLMHYSGLEPIIIYHSPIRNAIDCIRSNDGLVVLGTRDPILKHINLDEFKSMKNIELHIVEDGDHSLDVDNFVDSIDIMKSYLLRTKEYILRVRFETSQGRIKNDGSDQL